LKYDKANKLDTDYDEFEAKLNPKDKSYKFVID